MSNTQIQRGKETAGRAAADLIQNGMVVGLGTGSTAECFVDELIRRNKERPLKIKAVSTSEATTRRALAGGIVVEDLNRFKTIDITVDGADEVDKQKRLIKGGGGALLREKVVASLSKELVVIVDESKVVEQLGRFPLPVEVIPFAYIPILEKLIKKGYKGVMRLTKDGTLYVTDNQNYIIDISFNGRCDDPEKAQSTIRSIPGILETGFFLGLATRVIVGHLNGTVTMIN